MDVKSITKIAMLGCFQFIAFVLCSDILYLELITFFTVLFASTYKTKEAVLGSITFAILNMAIRQGVTMWSMMYLLIFPLYSLIISVLPIKIKSNLFFVVIMCGLFSFLTGQLIQLPYMLLSGNFAYVYIIVGLKTSLIQGALSMIGASILFKPTYEVLQKIR